MTISATTQGLRMGVATSSSRPTVPFDGQVISETDTDSLQVYKGSAWAPVTGLTFITGASFSAVANTSLPANTFSATYANYKVLLTVTASSVDGQNVQARFRAAGTDNTTSNYNVGGFVRTFAGATGTQESTNDTSMYFFDSGSTYGAYISMDIFGPQLTQTTAINSQTTRQTGACFNGNMFKASTSFDAMTFYVASGTMTGNYKVYGYSNS